MANVYDVAEYIRSSLGPLSEYKLQKLVYYAQAWSLVWDGTPMFPQVIKAWADGPVSPELWHRWENGIDGNVEALTAAHRATLDAVLDWYGSLSADQLIQLSHRESPWRRARGSTAPGSASTTPIPQSWMREYYAGLVDGSTEKRIPDAVKSGALVLLEVPEDRVGDLHQTTPVEADDLVGWLRGDRHRACHES